MKKTVYLARHGETDANLQQVYQGVSRDYSLNENGRHQAKLLGQWLKAYLPLPDVIYSSPAKRALETAGIIAYELDELKKKPGGHGYPVFYLPKLHEINHGDWEGLSDDAVRKKYPGLYKRWRSNAMKVAFPGGESMLGAKRRILKVWRKDILELEHSTILIIAHGGVNFQILNDALESEKLRNIWQDNTCLNIIESGKRGLRVKLLNSTAHLLPPFNPSEAQK